VSVALEPGSKNLAFCSSGQSEVSVQNWEDGNAALPFRGREGDHFYNFTFSTDGSLFAAGYERSGRHGVVVWPSSTPQKRIADFPCSDRVGRIVFSPNGRFMAVANYDGGVTLYHTSDFKRYLFRAGDEPSAAAFSPDSQFLAVIAADEGLIRLWKVDSNRESAVLEAPGAGSHSVLFSRNGGNLVAASEKEIRIWELALEKLDLSGHAGGVPGVAFSPDGTLLASVGKDQRVKIWDSATGEIKKTLDGFKASIEAVAFSRDGKWLATGDWGGGIRIWEVGSWQEQARLEHQLGAEIWSVAFSPDGSAFAACGERGVALWRMEHRTANGGNEAPRLLLEPVRLLSSRRSGALCFSGDSTLLAWTEGNQAGWGGLDPSLTLRLWDLVSSRPYPAPPAARLLGSIRSLAFHAKSNHLLFIGPNLVPEFWDVAAGQKVFAFDRGDAAGVVRRNPNQLGAIIALSADGAWLAQHGAAVRVWDLDKKDLLFILPEEQSLSWSFAWSPDRKLLAIGSSDGSLAIWNIPKVRSQLAEIGLDW
jgi:WD40 repeat protein